MGGMVAIVGVDPDLAVMHLKLGQSLIEIAGVELSFVRRYAAMAYYFDTGMN